MQFLKNTDDFWVGQLPISLFTFVILHYIEKLFGKRRWVVRVLSNFRWFGFLWTLLLDNVQNLSFRFFQQLRDVVPSGRLQAPLLYFNLGVAYCTFLLVLLLVNHYYSYLLRWVPGGAILFLDGLRPSRRSAWYAATMFLLRILSGATHALLPYSPIAKLAILLGLQLAMFLLASAHFR